MHLLHRLTVGLLASTVVIAGCQNRQIVADGSSETDDDTGDGECHIYGPEAEQWLPGLSAHSLDILLVVDGTIGSAGAQARLAAGLAWLVAELDANQYGLDYRIAVTTTDMGPPACDPLLTTPEHGNFVASSCLERLADFVDADGQDFGFTCTNECSLEHIERLPTKIAQAAEPAPRAWIERDGVTTNLPADVDLLEALRCTAMVGVSSCRFESPLAAIEAAFLGSQTPGHPNFGFFRPDSRWAFVIISDAADCSWSETGLEIFDPDGLRTFWSDPLADAPTPAVCWNAGTVCDNTLDGLDCEGENHTVDGAVTGLAGAIVLRPAEDFSEPLRSSGSWYTDVVLFSGLTLEGERHFEYAQDPDFALEHGIGPGCDNGSGTVALPPVRTWEFLQAFHHFDLEPAEYHAEHSESICAPDFGPTFFALGSRSRQLLDTPHCYFDVEPCDIDPATELLDVECTVEAFSSALGQSFDIPECARGEDGAYLVDPDTGRAAMPDAQTDLCYLARVDAQQRTPDTLDDAWTACTSEGLPLGFEFVARDGRVPDEYIEAKCSSNAG